jgi:hypothetical protein
MGADVLIFKKKGYSFEAKIKQGMHHGHTPNSYHIKVNIHNPKDLALFLQDLRNMHDAPMDKAIKFYFEAKENPFF